MSQIISESFLELGKLPDVPAVYRVLDDKGRVLYVGAAKSLLRRWRGEHHQRSALTQHRATLICWQQIDREQLASAEREAIERFTPLFNKGRAGYVLRPDALETIDTHIYFPPAVFERMKQLATLNRRSMSAEVIIAVEEHLVLNKPTLLLADRPSKRKPTRGRVK